MTMYDLLAALCYVFIVSLAVFVLMMAAAALVERVVWWWKEWRM